MESLDSWCAGITAYALLLRSSNRPEGTLARWLTVALYSVHLLRIDPLINPHTDDALIGTRIRSVDFICRSRRPTQSDSAPLIRRISDSTGQNGLHFYREAEANYTHSRVTD